MEHSDAYFLVQALKDFSAKQDKANKIAKLIASMVYTQTFLELFRSFFSYGLVLLPRLFALVANLDGQCINMMLCSLYLHWW